MTDEPVFVVTDRRLRRPTTSFPRLLFSARERHVRPSQKPFQNSATNVSHLFTTNYTARQKKRTSFLLCASLLTLDELDFFRVY